MVKKSTRDELVEIQKEVELFIRERKIEKAKKCIQKYLKLAKKTPLPNYKRVIGLNVWGYTEKHIVW